MRSGILLWDPTQHCVPAPTYSCSKNGSRLHKCNRLLIFDFFILKLQQHVFFVSRLEAWRITFRFRLFLVMQKHLHTFRLLGRMCISKNYKNPSCRSQNYIQVECRRTIFKLCITKLYPSYVSHSYIQIVYHRLKNIKQIALLSTTQECQILGM